MILATMPGKIIVKEKEKEVESVIFTGQKEKYYVVTLIGPDLPNIPCPVKVGDIVRFERMAGYAFEYEKENYIQLDFRQIHSVVEEEVSEDEKARN